MSAADQEKKGGLITRAATSVTWSGLGMASQRITQTLVVIVLARLLVPEDFGLVAVAALTINAVEKIKGLGMASAFIQRRSEIEKAANALFYSNLIMSVAVYALIWLFAPHIAVFFNSAGAELVLRVMALQLFAEAGSTVPRAMAVKRLQFKKLTLINFCGSIVGGLLSLLLAVTGWGVWALVYGALAGAFISMVLWLLLGGWRPGKTLDWRVLKEMVRFGARLSIADSLDAAIDTCNRLFVGRFLGLVSLGHYDVTTRIVQIPFRNIISAGNRVALPAFCELQEDEAEIRRWYLKMIGLSSLIMVPLSICLIFLAGRFVPALLGDQWIPIIPYLRLLGPAIFFLPLLYTRPVYVCSGRADLLLRFTALRLAGTVPLLFCAARISLFAVCLAEVAALVVFAALNQWLVVKMIGLPVQKLLQAIKAPLTGGAAVALTLGVGDALLSRWIVVSNVTALFILLPAAAVTYLLFLYFWYPEQLRDVKRLAALSVNRP